jgi:hypothetical protein
MGIIQTLPVVKKRRKRLNTIVSLLFCPHQLKNYGKAEVVLLEPLKALVKFRLFCYNC